MPWKYIEPLKNAKENIATPTAQYHIRENVVNSNGNLHAHDGCSQNNKPYSGCRPLRCQHTVTFEPCIQAQAPWGRVAQRDQAVVLHLTLKKWIILDQVGGKIFKNVRSSLCLLDLISTQCCGKCNISNNNDEDFTHRTLYTERDLHRAVFTQTLLHTEVFTQKNHF